MYFHNSYKLALLSTIFAVSLDFGSFSSRSSLIQQHFSASFTEDTTANVEAANTAEDG